MDNWGKNGNKCWPMETLIVSLCGPCSAGWLSCASPNWKLYFLSQSSSSLSLICPAKHARKGLHTNQHGHNHVNISTRTHPQLAVVAEQTEGYCGSRGACPALWQPAYVCHFDGRLLSLGGRRIWIDLWYGWGLMRGTRRVFCHFPLYCVGGQIYSHFAIFSLVTPSTLLKYFLIQMFLNR